MLGRDHMRASITNHALRVPGCDDNLSMGDDEGKWDFGTRAGRNRGARRHTCRPARPCLARAFLSNV